MPSLMKARSGVLNSNIGGNALAPLFSTGSLTTANLITDVTRLAGVQGDGAAYPDSSVGVWPAATNLVTNGGFETNTTGWSAWNSGASIARSTSQAKFGSASLEVTVASLGSRGARYILSLSATTVYTVSAWMKVPSGVTINMAVYDTTITILLGSVQLAGSGAWQRVSVSFTSDADGGDHSIFLMTFADYGAVVFYVDGVQVETGSIATPYIETDGGTASRSVGTIGFPSSLLSASAGTLAFRWKAGCPYTTTTRPRFMNWLSGNNYYALYYDTATDKFQFFRDNGSGSGDIVKSASQTFALGDTLTIQVSWSPTEIGIKVNTAAWVTLASTKVPSGLPATVGLGATTETPIGSLYWVWAGKAAISDSESIQVAAWGNNDPLPHMLPKAASPSLLAPFNGDGTFYRRSA